VERLKQMKPNVYAHGRKIGIRAGYDIESKKNIARKLAGIEE